MIRSPIRVLFVDHESRLSGGEQDLLDLVVALGEAVDCHVALPGDGPLSAALRDAGATVHFLDMSAGLTSISRWDIPRRPWIVIRYALSALKAIWSIFWLTSQLRPELIHTNSMKSHLLASIPARFLGLPIVWHVRDILNEGWLRRIFIEFAGRLPNSIACISKAVQSQFTGRALRKTVVIYNGIDISKFNLEADDSLRAEFGAAPGDILVGLVGQIAWWKGQDLLVEAASQLEDPRFKFVFVGECLFPENEGKYEKSIHDRVKEMNLESRVVFAGWSDDPPAAMAAMDIVVHASRLPEPFGRVVVEGMAAGKPVIASSIGAGPELLTSNEGRIVDPTDVPLLVDALESLSHPDEMRAKGESARRKAMEFDISNTASEVLELYSQLGIGQNVSS